MRYPGYPEYSPKFLLEFRYKIQRSRITMPADPLPRERATACGEIGREYQVFCTRTLAVQLDLSPRRPRPYARRDETDAGGGNSATLVSSGRAMAARSAVPLANPSVRSGGL